MWEFMKAPQDESVEEKAGAFVIEPTDSFTVLLYVR